MSRFKSVVITLFFLAAVASSGMAQRPSLTGEQIVKKMAAAYETANTYQDIGIAHRIKADGSVASRLEPEVYFKTFFDRPNRFRFEWENQFSSKSWGILWSDGSEVFVKWALQRMERQKNLEAGIAGATPFSLGAARVVPNLLMAGLNGFRLTQLLRVSRLKDEKVGDELCFVVRGYHPYGFQIDLWISKTDFLLRREREKNDDGTYNEELRTEIQLNGVIPPKKFQFSPIQKGELVAELIAN